jgi:hypothetical protein
VEGDQENEENEEIANVNFNRIQTWALEEARRRLEAEGILKDEES